LTLSFGIPFSMIPKMQTALTKKFLQLSFQAHTEETRFVVKNPQVSCENSENTTLRLVNPPNERLVSIKRKDCFFSIRKLHSNWL